MLSEFDPFGFAFSRSQEGRVQSIPVQGRRELVKTPLLHWSGTNPKISFLYKGETVCVRAITPIEGAAEAVRKRSYWQLSGVEQGRVVKLDLCLVGGRKRQVKFRFMECNECFE